MAHIGYLGAGTWACCLAHLLAMKGHKVVMWTRNKELAHQLCEQREHPKLKNIKLHSNISFTTKMEEAFDKAEWIIEGVTSAGMRAVFTQAKEVGLPSHAPIIITSKGIEQGSCLLLSELLLELLGEEVKERLGCLSGPGHAEEVIKGLPASVVCSAYTSSLIAAIQDLFTTPTFRVYPNSDIQGVEFGGALKNIIAIACGISDGLGYGDSAKAALMTRGLHEVRKLAQVKGCRSDTLNGLAGMGDLCVTCMSTFSRNYRFGRAVAAGMKPDEAQAHIGMVVEGAYSCRSVMQLAEKWSIAMPISEAIYGILYQGLTTHDAVKSLMQRAVKEEHL